MGGNSFSGFDLDAERKILRRGGEIVPLPPKAVELLIVLLKNRGEVVSKTELLDTVWEETFVEESVLSNNIYILRKTLAALGVGRDLIQTVSRRGYRFVADADEAGNDAELVVERHIFRQTLIKEILGEFGARVSAAGAQGENPTLLEKEFTENPSVSAQISPEFINSIAVLPLVNDSGDADLEYLSDGIAESLIDNLSLLPRLRVMARTTVFRYKTPGGGVSPQQIGAELDVEAVVTGRIRLFKGSLIIKVELVRARDAAQLWGAQYQRKPEDILEIQNEIAREIAGKLQLKLTRREAKYFPRRETVSSEAYHFYLKGRYFWNKRTAQWMKKGIENFQLALDCDPNYALAYSGLADSYVSFATVGALSPVVAIPRAKAAAHRALELNDRLAEAHAALAFIKNSYDWEPAAAAQHFNRAIEVNPSYSIAYHWYGFCLTARGEFTESIELMKQAQALDPLSSIINTVCGLPFYYMRRYGRAIEIYRAALETDATFFPAFAYLGMAYEQNGQYEEAVAAFRHALSFAPDNTFALASLGHVYAVSGNEEKSREIIGKLENGSPERYVSPYGMAEIYAGLKDYDRALKYLELAAEERSWWLIFADVNPRFDTLRRDPRVRKILLKMNSAK
jgi:TolB-like protein/DNA-binding winged helix-turn-helix (wHTH) protein/Tfp pilus assembly protein PilF